jgi:thiol-disulfide isomerase/thioredoxin
MVDTCASKAYAERHAGSSPALGISIFLFRFCFEVSMNKTPSQEDTISVQEDTKPLQKQLPTPLFFGTIMVAALGILWAIGRFTPSASPVRAGLSTQDTVDTIPAKAIPPASSRQAAPDFTSVTSEKKPVKLADYKGKVLLLNFWATWCGPCRMEMPELVQMQQKYADRGFTIIGMAEEDSSDKVHDFAGANGLTYPQVMVTQEIAEAYNVTSLPTTFLIDKNGKVISNMSGIPGDGDIRGIWEPQIEQALQEN